MKKAVISHNFILEFISINCAIMHDFAANGTSLPFFKQINHHK